MLLFDYIKLVNKHFMKSPEHSFLSPENPNSKLVAELNRDYSTFEEFYKAIIQSSHLETREGDGKPALSEEPDSNEIVEFFSSHLRSIGSPSQEGFDEGHTLKVRSVFDLADEVYNGKIKVFYEDGGVHENFKARLGY